MKVKVVQSIFLFTILLYGYISLYALFVYFNISFILISARYIFILALIGLLTVSMNMKDAKKKQNSFIVTFFLVLVLFMSVNGYGDPRGMVYYYWEELLTYLRFFLLMLLGYHWYGFPQFKKAMVIIMAVGIVVNLFSITLADTFLRRLLDDQTLAYELQYLLQPSCFFILLFKRLTTTEKRIVFVAFALYSIEQILFQKRLPLLRISLFIIAFLYISWYFSENRKQRYKLLVNRVVVILTALSLSALTVYSFGFNLGTYFTALYERFYEKGSFQETLANNARWEIGEVFYEEVARSREVIAGRGLGSVVFSSSFHMEDDRGMGFRPAAEMGLPTMMLKGGVILICYFVVLLFFLFKRLKYARMSILKLAFWSTAFIWFLLIYGEGFILGGVSSLNEVVIAYSIGGALSYRIK